MYLNCSSLMITPFLCILGFHSRDQQPCFSTKTKEDISIIIAFNSRRIGSGHQHGHHFIVWGHQHGGCDVMLNPTNYTVFDLLTDCTYIVVNP